MRMYRYINGSYASFGAFLLFFIVGCKTTGAQLQESGAGQGVKLELEDIPFCGKGETVPVPGGFFREVVAAILPGVTFNMETGTFTGEFRPHQDLLAHESRIVSAVDQALDWPAKLVGLKFDAGVIYTYHPHEVILRALSQLPPEYEKNPSSALHDVVRLEDLVAKAWGAASEDSGRIEGSGPDYERLAKLALVYHWVKDRPQMGERVPLIARVSQLLLDRGRLDLLGYLIAGIIGAYEERPKLPGFTDQLLAIWVIAARQGAPLERQVIDKLLNWLKAGPDKFVFKGQSKADFIGSSTFAEADFCLVAEINSPHLELGDTKIFTIEDGFLYVSPSWPKMVKVDDEQSVKKVVKTKDGQGGFALKEWTPEETSLVLLEDDSSYFIDKPCQTVFYGDYQNHDHADVILRTKRPFPCNNFFLQMEGGYSSGYVFFVDRPGKKVHLLKDGKVVAAYPGKYLGVFPRSRVLVLGDDSGAVMEALLLTKEGAVQARHSIEALGDSDFFEARSEAIAGIRHGRPLFLEVVPGSGAVQRWPLPPYLQGAATRDVCRSDDGVVFVSSVVYSADPHDAHATYISRFVAGEDPISLIVDRSKFDRVGTRKLVCFDGGAGLAQITDGQLMLRQVRFEQGGLTLSQSTTIEAKSRKQIEDFGNGLIAAAFSHDLVLSYYGRAIFRFSSGERLELVEYLSKNPRFIGVRAAGTSKLYLISRTWLEKHAGITQ